MRAAVFRGAGRPLAIEHREEPKPGPGDVVVKVGRCGISEVDLGMTSGADFDVAPGAVLGREVAGEIVELGAGVDHVRLGERIAVLPSRGCGRCAVCMSGRRLCCPEEPHFGGFAELARAPASRMFKLDERLSLAAGALLIPLATGLHAVRALPTGILPERVLVMGGGAAAVSVAFWAQRLWACSLIIASSSARTGALASAIGVEVIAEPADPDLLRDGLGGPPDVVFDSIGAPDSLQRAIDLAAARGQVLSVGGGFAPTVFSPLSASAKGLSVGFPFGCTAQELQEAALVIGERALDLVSSVITLEALPAMLEHLRGEHDETKVQLAFG